MHRGANGRTRASTGVLLGALEAHRGASLQATGSSQACWVLWMTTLAHVRMSLRMAAPAHVVALVWPKRATARPDRPFYRAGLLAAPTLSLLYLFIYLFILLFNIYDYNY